MPTLSRRVDAALKQNSGFKAVWEFPTEVEVGRARDFLKMNDLSLILSVRVRAQ